MKCKIFDIDDGNYAISLRLHFTNQPLKTKYHTSYHVFQTASCEIPIAFKEYKIGTFKRYIIDET